MTVTERQQEFLDFIVAFREKNGCSPSIPELQRAFGIRSPNGVAGHLHALEAKGLIRKADRGSRQIEVTGEAHRTRGRLHDLPVYGAIPAGHPTAEQASHAERAVTVDEETLGFAPQAGSFVLQVRGDSMKDAGILNGDLVVVERATNPRAGQIVAALIDGESTLKRLVRVDSQYFLKAENPEYPQLHPRASLSIQGVARAVIRRLGP